MGIGLLTLAALGCIFLAAFIKLWRVPPEINVSVLFPDELTLKLPDLIIPADLTVAFKQTVQNIPATVETDKPTEEPIPEDVLLYIEQESDLWAQEARRRRARLLKTETGSWDIAFRMLQREDNPE